MKRTMLFLCALALMFSPLFGVTWTPPAHLNGYWTPGTHVGIPGGIPTNRTNIIDVSLAPYSADKTGAVDCTAVVWQAIIAAPKDGTTVVYFPAGTYQLQYIPLSAQGQSGPEPLKPYNVNNVTLRGAGSGQNGEDPTILDIRSSTGISFGQGTQWTNISNPTSTITPASLTKGATTITVANASGFLNSPTTSGGAAARIVLPDDPSIPIVSPQSVGDNRFFPVYIESKSGNNLTLSGPIHADFSGLTGARIYQTTYVTQTGVGIEGFVIDGANSPGLAEPLLCTGTARNCWIKDVKIKSFTKHGIDLFDTINFEIRGCYIGPSIDPQIGLSNYFGLGVGTAAGMLFEDNIVVGIMPLIELNHGVVRSAFTYNFLDAAPFSQSFITNHGVHNQSNVMEGNRCATIQSDAYHGGESEELIFRNHFTAIYSVETPTQLGYTVALNRWARGFGLVGNILLSNGFDWSGGNYATAGVILGNPYGGQIKGGTVQLSATPPDPWLDWDMTTGMARRWPGTLTERTTGNTGKVTLDPGHAANFSAALAIANNNGIGKARGLTGHQFVGVTSVDGDVVTFIDGSTPISPAHPLGGNVPLGDPVIFTPSALGFQELDLDVELTLTRVHNFDYHNNTIPSLQRLPPGDVLPKSMVYGETEPAWWPDGYTWPPFDPETPSEAGVSSLPAGARYVRTLPPAITAASVNTLGTILTIQLNKPVFLGAGGSGGFTLSGAGLTFKDGDESTNIRYDITGHVILDEESLTLTYVTVADGWEDLNGNDLPSRTGANTLTVYNGSQFSGTAVWYDGAEPTLAGTNSNHYLFPAQNLVQPVTVLEAGSATKIRLYIGANQFNSAVKFAVYNSAGVLLASQTNSVTITDNLQIFPIPTFPVTPGVYYLSIATNNNNDPVVRILTGQPANSRYWNYTSYPSFPPNPIVPVDGTANKLGISLRVIPDAQPPPTITYAVGVLVFMRR